MPEITVVITTYNLERYIDTCLRELEAQTFRDFEVLVVDDCSKDNTAAIVGEHVKRQTIPIRMISTQKNQGLPGRTRNFALNSGLINGKYLIFLDGDDGIEPEFLERLHARAVQSSAEITLCAYDRFEDETGHVLCQEMRGFPEEIMLPPQNGSLAFINGSLWNKLILTECIGELRIPDFRVGEDISFQCAIYERCRKIACVDEILIHYRVHASSVISNTPEESIYQFAEELHRLWKNTAHAWLKSDLSLIAFVHIGISMPFRAHGNQNIPMRQLIHWITTYFNERYSWFHSTEWKKLSHLKQYGVRGLGIWGALMCYRLRCFPAFIALYKAFIKIFHIDIKY